MAGDSRQHRLAQALWEVVGQRVFRLSFHNWYGVRNRLLRAFGATIDPAARVRPSVRISHPYKLTIGANSTVGDNAVLYCLGPITIGRRCTISQYAHLCSAGHDYTRADMPLITDPIVIEDDAWIAADVFVGPGVTVGADTVVGSRSTVMHPLPAGKVCAGDNAKVLGDRVIRVGKPVGANA